MVIRKLFPSLITILSIIFSCPIVAANISGVVKDASNKPAAAASVSFSCPNVETITKQADKYGRYRVMGLPNVKWCILNVTYSGKNSSGVKVNSGSGSKDINVVLQNADKNKWRITF
jgi:hypothetical protein